MENKAEMEEAEYLQVRRDMTCFMEGSSSSVDIVEEHRLSAAKRKAEEKEESGSKRKKKEKKTRSATSSRQNADGQRRLGAGSKGPRETSCWVEEPPRSHDT